MCVCVCEKTIRGEKMHVAQYIVNAFHAAPLYAENNGNYNLHIKERIPLH